MKETIFISHATHQDDYPAGWLASKLSFLGYKVFIDLEDLRAGDTFYTVIQPLIQNEASKFISINTINYIEKALDPNSGVRKEINAASTITDDNNFIIPIRFDSVGFSKFPMDYVSRKSVDFNNRWGEGLNELLLELEKLGVPKNDDPQNPLQLWNKAIKIRNQANNNPEKIHSNWFEINLPEFIYIHKPESLDKALLKSIPSTCILEANYIICFASTESVAAVVPLINSFKIKTTDFLENEELQIDDSFKLIKPYDKLKQILNKSFKNHCFRKGLKSYKQASEKEVFYFRFTKDEHKPVTVSLKKYQKTRTQLNGNKRGKNWHFAISAKSELKPFPHFRLYYHIVFTDESLNAISNVSEQHALRRSFSQHLYNKKTFELILASMLFLSNNLNNDYFEIQIDHNRYMNVANFPLSFNSNKSYIEPKAKIQDDLF